MEILRYENVRLAYGERVAAEVSFALHEREITALVGESGSGKSTVLRAPLRPANGAEIARGRILYRGKPITAMTKKELRELRGAKIGMIFQNAADSFCPVVKIGAQLHEILSAHAKRTVAQAKETALELFAKLRLDDGERIWNSYPFQLSGGMCARVGIAAALLAQPELLLADEPTAALDAEAKRQVMRTLLALRDRLGMSLLLVTHDMGVAAISDRTIVLKDGRVVESGTTREMFARPKERYTEELLAAATGPGRAI